MIYAIHAVGTPFIKFGKANNVGRRLKEMETGCPHDLHILAVADWPDGAEKSLHRTLRAEWERGEWFRDGELSRRAIAWMLDKDAGLSKLQSEVSKQVRDEERKSGSSALSSRVRAIASEHDDLASWWRDKKASKAAAAHKQANPQ